MKYVQAISLKNILDCKNLSWSHSNSDLFITEDIMFLAESSPDILLLVIQ